jgi:hypothetical protein
MNIRDMHNGGLRTWKCGLGLSELATSFDNRVRRLQNVRGGSADRPVVVTAGSWECHHGGMAREQNFQTVKKYVESINN